MEICLEGVFAERWAAGDAFARALGMSGQVYRALEGRRTLRFEEDGQAYFLKVHTGVGWGEIAKNLLSGRLPVVDASNEWRALRHLHRHGLAAATPLAYGRRGCNPARRQSFLVMSALEGMVDLETLCRRWPTDPPGPALRRYLVNTVAQTARAMHDSGLNHRDFYLCHLWLPTACLEGRQPMQLYLLDLHRAQMRAQVPRRWRIKDLGALYYSALDIGLTRRDVLRFIRAYTGLPAARSLRRNRAFWQAVQARAAAIYKRDFGREPPWPL